MNIVHLAPDATKSSEILRAVACARGCATEDEIANFLSPLPTFENVFAKVMGDYPVSRDRIAQAIAAYEVVVVYGDFDADGICATAQMVRFLRAAGANVRWFSGTRSGDQVGLTSAGIARCLATHRPKLIIAVDCGSNSRAEILELSRQGVDTIVLDHHMLALTSPGAVAHLNPQAYEAASPLTPLCAAALAYLWCDALAQDLGLERQWDRIREGNLIISAIGTSSDSVPLLGLNRALLKHAVYLARQPIVLEKTPGLVALAQTLTTEEITARTLGAEWAPRINACGRLGDPATALQLLLSSSVEEARIHLSTCDEAHSRRRKMHDAARIHAFKAAEIEIQRNPEARVLVLAHHDWPAAVLGTLAMQIRDRFNRPTIVLGWCEEIRDGRLVGIWSGSGRSFDSADICPLVQEAVLQGMVLSGGGHPAAVGVRLLAEQLETFRAFINAKLADIPLGAFQHTYEVLGAVDDLPPQSWLKIFERLAPFGRGNPQPFLCAKRAQLAQPPYPRRSRPPEQKVFAMSGLFRRDNVPEEGGLLQFDWFDPERAAHVWFPGRAYNVLLTVSHRKGSRAKDAEPLFNWRVAHCEPAA